MLGTHRRFLRGLLEKIGVEKILLVEDDPQALRSLEKILTSNGFQVVPAASGFEALEKIQQDEFALVITDVRMPGMDGIETLKKVGVYQPQARKMLITGFAGDDAPIRAIQLSVDDYLMKPFGAQALLSSVQNALARYAVNKQKAELMRINASSNEKLLSSLVDETEKRLATREGRVDRLVELCACLSDRFDLSRAEQHRLKKAALCHDLGYVASHAGNWLTEDPQQHAAKGSELAELASGYHEAAPILKSHHSEPTLAGRILAVCEAYETLVSEKGVSVEQALDTLSLEKSGDGEILEALSLIASSPLESALRSIAAPEASMKSWEALLHLAQVYAMMGETETADAALARIRDNEEPLRNDDYRFKFLLTCSQNLLRQEKYLEAHMQATAALEVVTARRLGEPHASAANLEIGLGRLFLADYTGLEEILKRADETFEKFENPRSRARANLYLALWALSTNEKTKAGEFLERCKSMMAADQMQEWLQAESHVLKLSAGRDAYRVLAASPDGEKPGIRIYSLGPFHVYREDFLIKEEEWKSKKAKLLLIYLLFNQGKPVTEEKLCDVFWPDSDLDRSRKNLHQAIYLLRRVLEPSLKEGNQSDYILFQQNTYQFNSAAPYWWDVEELKRNYHEGERLWGAGEREKALPYLQKVDNLFQGEMLEYQLEETWCENEREKTKEMFVGSLLSLSSYHEEKEELDVALELANRILARDPLNERGALQQIRLQYKSGKRSEAIRRYHEWCGRLKKELNLPPPPDLLTLYLEMTGATSSPAAGALPSSSHGSPGSGASPA